MAKKVFDFILFGGCGDLALRKLMPALYRAYCEDSFSDDCLIIPIFRGHETSLDYCNQLEKALNTYLHESEKNKSQLSAFLALVKPCKLDISVYDNQWSDLANLLSKDEQRSRLFYMAIPPVIFSEACQNLAQANLIHSNARIVVEKPIGYDQDSSREINNQIAQYFNEKQIFRIDHYLGKKTVQNLMALRFTNVIFEQLWDAKSIDHVQISISETVGLEQRAGFYDETGALRDMVQNHLLQLLCLVAMESPNKLDANSIRAEKVKVLQALRPLTEVLVDENTVRGQYVAGEFEGALVSGYLEELNKPMSQTETFVAIRAYIDNWRWSKVPFYLRTGKRMQQRAATIVIQFKPVSHQVYQGDVGPLSPNQLIITLQPDESIELTLMTKDLTQLETQLKPMSLNLNFSDKFQNLTSDSYKRLLMDFADNNPTLFIHRDEVNVAWQWIDPIIDRWQQQSMSPHLYRAGTWGPLAADELINEFGHEWFQRGKNDYQ